MYRSFEKKFLVPFDKVAEGAFKRLKVGLWQGLGWCNFARYLTKTLI